MAPRSGTVSKDWLNAKFEALEEKLDANTQILRDHMAQDRVDFDLVDRKLDAHNLRVDRLEQARANYENQKDWRDWIVFGILLLSMVAIGVCIEAKWHF